jgi:Spy/CpxP family protein refolding chaperone
LGDIGLIAGAQPLLYRRCSVDPGSGAPSLDEPGTIEPQLALNPQQKAAFDEYARTVRSRVQSMHEAIEPQVANAWSELAKPDADEAKVMLLFDQAGDQRRAFRRELGTATFTFLAKLTPEQRTKFVELARQRPWAKRHQDGAP